MRQTHRFLLPLALVAALVGSVNAAGTAQLAGEIKLPLPDNWQIVGDTTEYPFRVASADGDVDLLIFKSALADGATLDDPAALKAGVQRILDSVIMAMPEAKPLTTAGFDEGRRAGFTVDFTSTASSGAVIHHRLAAIIYRHPDGRQLLFTLWGRSPAAEFGRSEPIFVMLQKGFQYTGPQATNVFPTDNRRWAMTFLLAVLIAIVGGILWSRRQQATRAAHLPGERWLCACGTPNDISRPVCKRCGKARIKEVVSR